MRPWAPPWSRPPYPPPLLCSWYLTEARASWQNMRCSGLVEWDVSGRWLWSGLWLSVTETGFRGAFAEPGFESLTYWGGRGGTARDSRPRRPWAAPELPVLDREVPCAQAEVGPRVTSACPAHRGVGGGGLTARLAVPTRTTGFKGHLLKEGGFCADRKQ